MTQLVLSLFPGIDLLGHGFETEGFCVVRGPDLIYGGDIREFHPVHDRFDGVIGGPPCQDFSKARRSEPTGYGLEMLSEFTRCVTEAQPLWFLIENVPTATVACRKRLQRKRDLATVTIPGAVTLFDACDSATGESL